MSRFNEAAGVLDIAPDERVLGFGLAAVCLLGQRKRDSQEGRADPAKPSKFDTTLGEFHAMREALFARAR